MLADGKTVALVTPDARVTWLCHPRPDSAAALRRAGRRPRRRATSPCGPRTTARRPAQRYVDGHAHAGDALGGPDRDRLPRPRRPATAGVRLVRVLEGTAEAIVEFAPRPDFGRMPIALRADPRRPASCSARPIRSRCYAPGLDWEIDDDGVQPMARARDRRRRPAVRARAALRQRQPRARTPRPSPSAASAPRRTWRSWLDGLRLPALARDAGRAQRADPARRCATSRPARSWRPRRRACPRRSAASATGTTATAGCATPRSRRWRWSSSDRRPRPRRCSATSTGCAQAEQGAGAPAPALLGASAATPAPRP